MIGSQRPKPAGRGRYSSLRNYSLTQLLIFIHTGLWLPSFCWHQVKEELKPKKQYSNVSPSLVISLDAFSAEASHSSLNASRIFYEPKELSIVAGFTDL